MLKVPAAFRGIERPNERSDTSVQSFDCARGSLAQASLDGMERQLDGVKIGRILRQESEACANTPESLLDPSDLVEGHIVSHHNVSMLERPRQTLLDVSQVPLLADKVENLLRIRLQRRRAPSTGHRLERSIFVKTLQPADRGTCADLEVFGSITSRSPCFHELNHANSQVSRIRSPHWSNPAESMR